jgi:protoheme ferro-lyase
MKPSSYVKRLKVKKSIILVTYSQFSSIVCEKSENEMKKHLQQILLEGLVLLVLGERHFL